MSSRYQYQDEANWQPWLPVIAALAGVTLVLLRQFEVVALPWLVIPLFSVVGGTVTFFSTVFQTHTRTDSGWQRVFFLRMFTWIVTAVWTTWIAAAGWSVTVGFTALVATVCLSVVGGFCPTPPRLDPRAKPAEQQPDVDRRHPLIQEWEARIRTISKLRVVVTRWESWENSRDGLRLFVELPTEQGTTAADLATYADALAASARLPRGCAVRVLDSDRQGIAVLDVMLRNTLSEQQPVYREPVTPASINDEFPVLTSPRGQVFNVCLRIWSMVIGGTTGSGKTTLLHRLIMWLARCTDTLIWIVDLNGGGLAEPWIHPWANGLTPNPVVDWVADNDEEGAVLVAVAAAIARDRKTNKHALRRKRAAKSFVLPVDEDMPAIVVLTDEGGEVRKAATLFGRMCAEGITTIVQIGRAEAVRGIISVLRGTADLMDKAFRTNAALRLCLRMEEDTEYAHVLGKDPGKTWLGGAPGAGFIKTPDFERPVLGVTVNVDPVGIDEHAIACGPLRPKLDQAGLRVAAQVTASRVIGGKDPTDYMDSLVMQHADMGMAYTGRWERYAEKLKQMRDAELDEDGDDDEAGFRYSDTPVPVPAAARGQSAAAPAAAAKTGGMSALDRFERDIANLTGKRAAAEPADDNGGSQAKVLQLHGPKSASSAHEDQDVARGQILSFIHEAGMRGRSASEIEHAIPRSRSLVYAILREERDRGMITKNAAGLYVLGDSCEQAV